MRNEKTGKRNHASRRAAEEQMLGGPIEQKIKIRKQKKRKLKSQK